MAPNGLMFTRLKVLSIFKLNLIKFNIYIAQLIPHKLKALGASPDVLHQGTS